MALPARWRAAAATLLTALASTTFAAAPSVTPEPAQLVLGTGATVAFTVHVDGPSDRVSGATSVGTLVRESLPSEHDAVFRYTPPGTRFPQLALVAFWVPNGDQPPEISFVRLPLFGRTELEVTTTAPKAMVKVEVAGKIFGPMESDALGNAKVPIEVPPGVTAAKVLGEAGGRVTSASVSIPVPPTNPLAAVLAPSPIRPGGTGWLWVLHTGKLDASKLQVTVQGGTAKPERTESDRALYRVTPAAAAKTIGVTAALKGRPDAKAQASVEVKAPPPPEEKKPPPPQEEPKVIPPPSPLAGVLERVTPAALVGGYFGGAENRGFAVAIGAAYRLPWLGERLSAELELGLRTQSGHFSSDNNGAPVGYGTSVLAVPVELAARYRVLERGPWSLDARVGGGPMPFSYRVAFDPDNATGPLPGYSDAGLGGELFAAVQAAYRRAPYELFVELRGSYSRSTQALGIDTVPGGLFVSVGGRYSLPGR